MLCPKCGAQVEDKLTVCPYCKEELKAEEAKAEEAKAEEVKAEEAEAEKTEEAAEQTEEKAEKAPKKEKKAAKVDFKNPKTIITCIAAVIAVIILIAAICGIVSAAQKNLGPEKVAENYIEAMADGKIKKALKRTAPWVLREMALGLDLKENASVGKIAREYEEQLGDFGLGGNVKIEDVTLVGYTDSDIGAVLTDLDIFEDYSIKYKEIKDITEVATVEVEASVKIFGEKQTEVFTLVCARFEGSWIVIYYEG